MNSHSNEEMIKINPSEAYGEGNRHWQGIPTIERTKAGRLWAAFYSGEADEGANNYVIAVISDNDGLTWSKPVLAIDPPEENIRAFDPCLWTDPLGRLWLFWAQSEGWYDGKAGVWAIHTSNPDDEIPNWSEPKRIANGIMMNKPTVLTMGEWLFPCAVWGYTEPKDGSIVYQGCPKLEGEMFSNVILSADQGKSFSLIGHATVPERHFDEHMIVEKKDGSLWMLVRTYYGIGESFSYDKGKTWSEGRPTALGGPDSRFFIRRLNSGNLLLINHYQYTTDAEGTHFKGRNHLTAMISEDDGHTWKGHLLLDEREDVSYPDAIQSPDGKIYVIYDRSRKVEKEILLAAFYEQDVLEKRYSFFKFKHVVSKAKG